MFSVFSLFLASSVPILSSSLLLSLISSYLSSKPLGLQSPSDFVHQDLIKLQSMYMYMFWICLATSVFTGGRVNNDLAEAFVSLFHLVQCAMIVHALFYASVIYLFIYHGEIAWGIDDLQLATFTRLTNAFVTFIMAYIDLHEYKLAGKSTLYKAMAQRLQMDSPGAVGPAFIGGGSILALAIVVFHIKYELDTRRFKNDGGETPPQPLKKSDYNLRDLRLLIAVFMSLVLLIVSLIIVRVAYPRSTKSPGSIFIHICVIVVILSLHPAVHIAKTPRIQKHAKLLASRLFQYFPDS